MTPAELAKRLNKNNSTIRNTLKAMLEAGKVTKRFDRKYSAI